MAAVALRPIHKIRLRNLKEIIDKRFQGNASQAARAIERSHTFMWQLMNGYRSIGEETARNIEAALKLGENALDRRLERTKELVAHVGNGVTASYKMVPKLALDALDEKPQSFMPCPDERCTEKSFCAEITADDMAELEPGDLIFADRGEVKPVNRKLFVVQPKGASPCVMQARSLAGRWVYALTGARVRGDRSLDAKDVRVIARVLLIVRNL